jgi:hypothetical protein
MCIHHFDLRCYHSSCSFLDDMGNVCVCSLVPNPNGSLMSKKVGFQLLGVLDKKVRRRRDVFG